MLSFSTGVGTRSVAEHPLRFFGGERLKRIEVIEDVLERSNALKLERQLADRRRALACDSPALALGSENTRAVDNRLKHLAACLDVANEVGSRLGRRIEAMVYEATKRKPCVCMRIPSAPNRYPRRPRPR